MSHPSTRLRAIRYLAIAASTGGTLSNISRDLGDHDAAAVAIARRALVGSISGDNWRATRAEAECRLRCSL